MLSSIDLSAGTMFSLLLSLVAEPPAATFDWCDALFDVDDVVDGGDESDAFEVAIIADIICSILSKQP